MDRDTGHRNLRSVRVPNDMEALFAQAEEVVSEFFLKRKEDPKQGTIEIFGERYILVRAASLSVEFFGQVSQLFGSGKEIEAEKFSRNFLFDLAHAIGKADARSFHNRMNLKDPISKLSAGPVHFSHSGWAFVEIFPESHPVPNDDFYLLFDHPFSFESDAWLRSGKTRDFPVCIMSAGYSSGWCEESFGVHLVSSEIQCKACGDQTCRFIMAPPGRIEEYVQKYEGTKNSQKTLGIPKYDIPDFFSRKRAEEELQKLYQQLKETDHIKTEFFANVSHELRTPLALILGPTEKWLNSTGAVDAPHSSGSAHLQQLPNIPEVREELLRDLKIIRNNAQSLFKTVNNLQDVSKLEAGKIIPKYKEFDLAHYFRSVTALFEGVASERKIQFSVEMPQQFPVEADELMMQQIVTNLLSNAFKFVPDSGEVNCLLYEENGNTMIHVRDNGPGIPLSMREAIFERFVQIEGGPIGKFGGSGLGLAIVKDFVSLQNGSIEVRDAPEGGALFVVTIPLKAHSSLTSEKINPRSNSAFKISATPLHCRGTILVIEDNSEMNGFISNVLSKDYRVISVFNGKDGLSQAIHHLPDLILSDIMMPVMTGEELVKQVRNNSLLNSIPIVLLTARSDEKLKLRLLSNGAQDYLMKPFSAEELRIRIDNLISMKKTRDLLQTAVNAKESNLEDLAKEITQRKDILQKTLEETKVAKAEVERLLKLRDEFISIAAHELKTPLTPLKMQHQLLKLMINSGQTSDAAFQASLKVSQRQIDHFVKLVDDLLDVSRISLGQLEIQREEVNLSELVKTVVERNLINLENSQCPIDVHLGEGVAGKWDRNKLEQVITNLLSNSMKYGRGKPIQIKTFLGPDHKAYFSIRDFGIGIAKIDQTRIFDRFERATGIHSYAGLGLGLYIVRQITTAHGGEIQVKSEPNAGAEFTVCLPTEAI